MEGTPDFIEKIEARNTHLGQLGNFSSGLFDGPKQYIHTFNLYFHLFNCIPNRITMHHSKVQNIISRIEKDFANRIIDKHYLRYSIPGIKIYKYSYGASRAFWNRPYSFECKEANIKSDVEL